jgi:hypothetical protein
MVDEGGTIEVALPSKEKRAMSVVAAPEGHIPAMVGCKRKQSVGALFLKRFFFFSPAHQVQATFGT